MSSTREKQINANHQASAFTLFFEHLDLASIYTMFLHPILHAFLEEIGKYFMFPLAAASNLVLMVLSWREYYLDRQPRFLVGAAVQTVAAVAITTAVIGALVASAVFALATPIIFTATLGAKAIYHAGAAFYHSYQGVNAKTQSEKTAQYDIAKKQAISAGAGIIATVAVACVFIFAKFAVAGLGIAVSLFVAGYALYTGIKAHRASRAASLKNSEEESLLEGGNTLVITKGMSNDNTRAALREATESSRKLDDNSSDKKPVDDTHSGLDHDFETTAYTVPGFTFPMQKY